MFWNFSSGGSGGTLSVDVLGVDRLSSELLGKLLVEEFVEVKVVKLISTLWGLCLIFWKVDVLRNNFEGLIASIAGLGFSICGCITEDPRGLEDDTVLGFIFEDSAYSLTGSESLGTLRFGDGDLDEAIHDFLAKVAKDSVTVLLLSRAALGSVGTGGMTSPGAL